MKLIRSLLLFLPLLLLTACAPQPTRVAQHGYSPLILISIDGYRHDYIKRGLSPNLAELAADGVRATAMRPAYPTLTFPNHYAIVTGLYPDHSGIVDNDFYSPVSGKKFVYNKYASIKDPSWWGGVPIWVGAERQGKHAATEFWPGSDVAIDGVRPEHWHRFDGKVTPDQRVDQVLKWLGLPRGKRPDFVTLYFEQVDHAGHEGGPDSKLVNHALRVVDAALGRLIRGLRQRGIYHTANIIVVSDHGMRATSLKRMVVLDKLVDMKHVRVIRAGVLAALAARPGYRDQVDTALLKPHPHMHCWEKANLPARLHYGTNPRIAPLICIPEDGWLIETQQYLDRPNHHISMGEHGYDNADPQMGALFVAHGPAFKRGVNYPEFDNVDVYPLMTHILGIKPAPNDGDFADVRGMLSAAELGAIAQ